MELVYLVILVGVGIWIFNSVRSGNSFRDRQQSLREGMTYRDVLMIMGEPTFVKNHQDGSYEYIYEKSEWKGMFRGGTVTRRLECVFSNQDILISIGRNENCNRSGW